MTERSSVTEVFTTFTLAPYPLVRALMVWSLSVASNSAFAVSVPPLGNEAEDLYSSVPEPETVTASTFQELPMDEKRRSESGYNVEELGTGFVKFDNGASMFVEEAWAAHTDSGEGDRIMGSLGGIKLEPFTFYTHLFDMDANVTFDVDSYERRQRSCGYMGAGYDGSQQHWVWGLLGRVELIPTGYIGHIVARITEAMYRSSETRREVVLS